MTEPTTDAVPNLSRKQIRKVLDRFRVADGEGFRLKDYATDDPMPDLVDKAQATDLLRQGVERLTALQELPYANTSW